MDHRTSQKWISEDRRLSIVQEEELRAHLIDCPECNYLYNQNRIVEKAFYTQVMVSPVPGFSNRWKTRLPSRIQEHQKRMARNFLISSGFSLLVLLSILMVLVLSGNTFVLLFMSVVRFMVSTLIELAHFQQLIISFMHILPPGLAILAWEIITCCFCIISLSWAITMWRLTFEGIKSR